jgi:hypothetical protein
LTEPNDDINEGFTEGLPLIADDGVSSKENIRVVDVGLFHELQQSSVPEPESFSGTALSCQLPGDLRICLEVIENDLLEAHVRFSEELKKRYEERLPLVRFLEDVLVSGVRFLVTTICFLLLN